MQGVSREIAGFLRLSVRAGWRHGWQPAELVRHVGRELGDTHASMAADVIADEMRGYAAATVGDRWAAQVSALGSEVWWGSDAEFLGARIAEAPATVQVAIELLHLLQHLPVLEQLCPLPGPARAAASSAIGDADTRILGKIRALLAKAESTEFPEGARLRDDRRVDPVVGQVTAVVIGRLVTWEITPIRSRRSWTDPAHPATDGSDRRSTARRTRPVRPLWPTRSGWPGRTPPRTGNIRSASWRARYPASCGLLGYGQGIQAG